MTRRLTTRWSLLCAVASIAAMMQSGCSTQENPITGSVPHYPSGWGYQGYDLEYHHLLRAMTGMKTDSVWGILVAEITSAGDSAGITRQSARLDAIFDLDGEGPFNRLSCNAHDLQQQPQTFDGHFLSLGYGLAYFANLPIATDFPFSTSALWRVELPTGEIDTVTQHIPASLEPIGLPEARDSGFDTLSIRQPIRVTWSNPQPGHIVAVIPAWYPDYVSDSAHYISYTPPVYFVPDTGGLVISPDSLAASGIPSRGALLLQIIRGNYSNTTTIDKGTKRVGNLAVTYAYGYAYLKP